MVAELTISASPEQRTRAFSLLPLMYGLGSIIGPLLGGNVLYKKVIKQSVC